MNSNYVKYGLIFLGGVVAGGAAGIFATKKHFEEFYRKKADDEIFEFVNDHEPETVNPDPSEDISEDEGSEEEEPPHLSKEQRKEIKEKLAKNHRKTMEYSNMYHLKNDKASDAAIEEMFEETEHPQDSDEDEELSEDEQKSLMDYEEHMANRDKPPRIISEETANNLPDSTNEVQLYLYKLDGVVTDEDDNVIEQPERLLGDCLEKYDFLNSEEREIYVLNSEQDTCYFIQKLMASFE